MKQTRRSWRLRKGGEAYLLGAAALAFLLAGIGGAGLLVGSPIFGLGGLFFLPLWLSQISRLLVAERSRVVEKSAITFLHALTGLLQAGVSLPAALFHLSTSVSSPFFTGLGRFLRRYEKGSSLSECLGDYQEAAQLGRTGHLLTSLELSYARGLPVLPLLQRMVPVLEADWEGKEKIRALRRSALGQALLAGAIPWALFLGLYFFEPEVALRFQNSKGFVPIVMVASVWEGIGVWSLWKLSSYY